MGMAVVSRHAAYAVATGNGWPRTWLRTATQARSSCGSPTWANSQSSSAVTRPAGVEEVPGPGVAVAQRGARRRAARSRRGARARQRAAGLDAASARAASMARHSCRSSAVGAAPGRGGDRSEREGSRIEEVEPAEAAAVVLGDGSQLGVGDVLELVVAGGALDEQRACRRGAQRGAMAPAGRSA